MTYTLPVTPTSAEAAGAVTLTYTNETVTVKDAAYEVYVPTSAGTTPTDSTAATTLTNNKAGITDAIPGAGASGNIYVRKKAVAPIPASAWVAVPLAARPEAPSAPAAPGSSNVTDTKITLPTTNSDYEYIVVPKTPATTPTEAQWKNNSQNSQTGGALDFTTTYDGTTIAPNTDYEVLVRKKATTTAPASPTSTPVDVRTKTAPAAAPDSGVTGGMTDTANNTATTIIVSGKAGHEYLVLPKGTTPTDADWGRAEKCTNADRELTFTKDSKDVTLASGTAYTVYVRKSGTDTEMPSNPATQDTATKPTVPTAGEGYTVDYNTETITPASGYEVRKSPNGTWSASPVSPLSPGTSYEVRKAANATDNIPASGEATFGIPARPAAPAALSKTDETIRNKGDGKVTGATADMEYSTNGGSSWTPCSGDIPLPAGTTVQVRTKATATTPHGESVSFTGETGTLTLTVTFNTQGGSTPPASISNLAYGAAITEPADPTRAGYTFICWTQDTAGSFGWNFGSSRVTDNITLYAQWLDGTVTVGGNVQQEAQGGTPTPVSGVRVELRRGSIVYDSATTDNNGNYNFAKVLPGLYNIVATYAGKTTTVLVEAKKTSADTVVADSITLPAANVSSQLVVRGGIPDIMVGGINDEAQSRVDPAGVVIIMTVEQKDESVSNSADIKQQTGTQTGSLTWFDIHLEMTVGGGTPTTIDATNNLMEIIIPMQTAGRTNFTAYRYHNSDVQRLTTIPNAAGEKIEVQTDRVIIWSKNYSTYAIGYDIASTPTGGGSSGGSGYYRDAEENFWDTVVRAIRKTSTGDVVKVNAHSYDRMPERVMRELRKTPGAALTIDWNGGDAIVIPAGKALAEEAGRVYYPLSYLAGKYKGMTLAYGDQNPDTGGLELLLEAPAAAGIDLEPTPPDVGIDTTVQASDDVPLPAAISPSPEQEPAARPGNTGIFVAIGMAAAALAAACWIFFRKRKQAQ